MPTEEVAAVHRLLDAFNRADFSALDELDPEAELQDEPRIPGQDDLLRIGDLVREVPDNIVDRG